MLDIIEYIIDQDVRSLKLFTKFYFNRMNLIKYIKKKTIWSSFLFGLFNIVPRRLLLFLKK